MESWQNPTGKCIKLSRNVRKLLLKMALICLLAGDSIKKSVDLLAGKQLSIEISTSVRAHA
jgi:hypothetical protein